MFAWEIRDRLLSDGERFLVLRRVSVNLALWVKKGVGSRYSHGRSDRRFLMMVRVNNLIDTFIRKSCPSRDAKKGAGSRCLRGRSETGFSMTVSGF